MCPPALALMLATLTAAQLKPLPLPIPGPTPVVTVAVTGGDEQTLKAANLAPSPSAVLDYFRKRAQLTTDVERTTGLLRGLKARDAATHDQASGELVCLGHLAVPLLRRAANDRDDSEAAARARQCLLYIEGKESVALTRAAVRLLASHKPAGAAEALLAYLPFAENDPVVQEIENALVAVGWRGGKPDPALLRALEDRVPARRAAAAQALCRLPGFDPRAAVGPLLKDSRPTVRYRAARGLIEVHHAEAIPALIDLLADLPLAQRQQAETYLKGLAGEWAVNTPPGNDVLSRRLARETWATWWRQIDGNRLRDEFQARTLSDREREQAEGLIQKLGDRSETVREKATADLIDLGTRTIPMLRHAREQPALQVQADKCLAALAADALPPLPLAAVRLLALRRPEDATALLLAYLPDADNGALKLRIAEVLPAVGCPAGKPNEVLIRALEDKVGERRIAAALALCQGGAVGQLPAVRRLLKDADPQVRLRVALSLAERKEKETIPVLIALLSDLPLDGVWEAEDYLMSVAGDRAPDLFVTADSGSRDRCRKAWETWWRANGRALDLARLDTNQHRDLLVLENWNVRTQRGRVMEISRDGAIRWEIGGLMFPMDAQVVPGGNILVSEQNTFVRERDRKGTVVWEFNCPNVVAFQRLPDGNTFIVCRNLLREVTPAGKIVYTHNFPRNTIMTARKFRDGQVAFFTYQGEYVRLDKGGKEVKTFRVPLTFGYTGAEVLSGDRVLVGVANLHKVMEYNATGKVIWEAAATTPGAPHRLRNGHTILSTFGGTRIVRLNRGGRIVMEMKDLPYRVTRVYAR